MLRSEPMDLIEFQVNTESVWEVLNCIALNQLGMLGGEKREALNDRGILNQVKACDESSGKIAEILE